MTDHDEIFARYQSVAQLIREGKQLEEATAECIWLWQHTLEYAPEMRGVRRSFYVLMLYELIQAHPPAKEQFASIRDALTARVRRADAPRDALGDWLSLNKVLQQEEVSLRWYGEMPVQPDWLPALQSAQALLFPLLLSRGRWSEAGLLLVNPVKQLKRLLDALMQTTPSAVESAELDAAQHQVVRKTAAEMYGALVAASRMGEASAVEEEAQRRDGSQEMKEAIAAARRAADERRPVEALF